MSSGPSLVFVAMTQIFETLPGGRMIGIFFFASLIFAVISTFFTILEIPRMYVQEKTHTSHQVSLIITAAWCISEVFSVLCQKVCLAG